MTAITSPESTASSLARFVLFPPATGESSMGGQYGKLYSTSPGQQDTARASAQRYEQEAALTREDFVWRRLTRNHCDVGSLLAHHQRMFQRAGKKYVGEF